MTESKSQTRGVADGFANEMIEALTLDEKLSMLAGADLWSTAPIERVGLGVLKMTDGPNGARGADGNHGPSSTSFPVGSAMGATFNPDLIEVVGGALAHETRSKGAHVLLGPTVNIPRVPVAGRNFECFSEDPVLSGTLAGAYINGLQSNGVAACIKHFVCNDQEYQRFSIDAQVDARTLHEIYLEPFRIAVAKSQPWAAMSAYNMVNGYTASESPLLDDVLRGELGFDGAVISDWYGTYGTGAVESGLDLEMPGPGRFLSAESLRSALDEGRITEDQIDVKVRRILTLMERTGADRNGDIPPERAEERPVDRDLIRRVGHESLVLLRNEGALPIEAARRIAVIGQLARDTPHQGGGSSAVDAHRTVSILEGLEALAPEGTDVVWSLGTRVEKGTPYIDVRQVTHGDGSPGFRVEYFGDRNLSGEPIRTIEGAKPWFTFFGSSDGWVEYDSFGLRITGTLTADEGGEHLLSIDASGGLRAWADDRLVVDTWDNPGEEAQSWTVHLDAGEQVALRIEYAPHGVTTYRWLGVKHRPPIDDTDTIREAVDVAAGADVAVVVVGLTPAWESEGFDRPDISLPAAQDDLVAAVAAAQPNTVVVTVSGSAVDMPWADDVNAIVHTWLLGQEGGLAIADVLYGAADPGGRLPVTFPTDKHQHPGLLNYPGEAGKVRYGEGIYVGYRGYDRLGLEPRFGFGFGLSYTTFTFEAPQLADQPSPIITGRLSNVGDRAGSEVVQVFALGIGGVERKLVGFEKIHLEAGETVDVSIEIDPDVLRVWDPSAGTWVPSEHPISYTVAGSFGQVEVPVGN